MTTNFLDSALAFPLSVKVNEKRTNVKSAPTASPIASRTIPIPRKSKVGVDSPSGYQ